ncbi:hypothetical protein WN48_08271 [Eufriesea mexicana]|nr:hypothetical protein WN48_08271 [Eufriesea mexicana]
MVLEPGAEVQARGQANGTRFTLKDFIVQEGRRVVYDLGQALALFSGRPKHQDTSKTGSNPISKMSLLRRGSRGKVNEMKRTNQSVLLISSSSFKLVTSRLLSPRTEGGEREDLATPASFASDDGVDTRNKSQENPSTKPSTNSSYQAKNVTSTTLAINEKPIVKKREKNLGSQESLRPSSDTPNVPLSRAQSLLIWISRSRQMILRGRGIANRSDRDSPGVVSTLRGPIRDSRQAANPRLVQGHLDGLRIANDDLRAKKETKIRSRIEGPTKATNQELALAPLQRNEAGLPRGNSSTMSLFSFPVLSPLRLRSRGLVKVRTGANSTPLTGNQIASVGTTNSATPCVSTPTTGIVCKKAISDTAARNVSRRAPERVVTVILVVVSPTLSRIHREWCNCPSMHRSVPIALAEFEFSKTHTLAVTITTCARFTMLRDYKQWVNARLLRQEEWCGRLFSRVRRESWMGLEEIGLKESKTRLDAENSAGYGMNGTWPA